MAKGDNGSKAENGAHSGTTTAIGPTIIIKGKLRSDEDLIVKGRIEAEISSSKALLVENSGIIKANIKVKSARISGVLVGNITAEERVEIAPDGRMVGDLTAPKIIINDGAAFRGKIDMQNFDEGGESKSARGESSGPAKQQQQQQQQQHAPGGGGGGGDHPTAHAK
jgi:cytoskeletal protein CcmA (bactofilin family)